MKNNTMNEFAIYDISLRMKKLGFDEPCFAFYQVENFEEKPCGVDDKDEYIRTGFSTCKNSEIPEHFTSAPTWHSAFVWFDENTEYRGFVTPSIKEGFFAWQIRNSDDKIIESDDFYPSRVEANLYCLEGLCEILEEKN
jgi:hypothetical protein